MDLTFKLLKMLKIILGGGWLQNLKKKKKNIRSFLTIKKHYKYLQIHQADFLGPWFKL